MKTGTARVKTGRACRLPGAWFGTGMRIVLLLLTCALSAFAQADTTSSSNTVLIVAGAPGDSEYGSNFVHQVELWQQACAKADCRAITLGLGPPGSTNDLELLREAIAAEPAAGPGQLWIVLIGHGTFDGQDARFNLRGPDVSAADLSLWLKPIRRPLILIDTSACSAPFLSKLSGTNRVIITATRSGSERNFTRFGQYFAESLLDPGADLDKDGQVSLLEVFLAASRRASDFYQSQGRIITEHALLDDNGDALGTPADWFTGLRATKKAKEDAAPDGLRARQIHLVPSEDERRLTSAQRAQRDELERAVFALREKKSSMAEDEYYAQLENILLNLARIYESGSAKP